MNNIYLPKSNKLISFPNPLDKPSFLKSINYNNIKKHPNKLSNEQILNINKNNINNYYDYLSEIVYSEEIYFGSKNISYDELLEYINLKSVYSQNKYKNFKYINHKYDNNIFFSSNFESGNLRMAIKHSDYEYDLILRPETNSPKTFHWFFFLVELNKPIKSKQYIIKFNIINISRNTMLLDEKVRVLSYYNNYWARDTFNIFFYENNIPNLYDYEENLITEEIEYYNNYESYFYTLSFSFDFSKIDTNEKYVFFSYSFPYTYTNLVNFISSSLAYNSHYLKYEEIGKSCLGNSIHMLTITNFKDPLDLMSKKKYILFTARIHPGETNSSFIIQSIIEHLLSNDINMEKLRRNYIFKIIPMLNPDGVILGNYRCNYNGLDLNRMWIESNVEIYPCNFYVNEIINKILKNNEIFFFCDFHGHSNKQNYFLYSCGENNNENDLALIHLFNRDSIYFDKKACYNKISPQKMKTARAVMKNKYGIELSFCLESSLCSFKLPNGSIYPFNIDSYKKIGKDFIYILSKFCNNKIYNSVISVVNLDIKDKKKGKKGKKNKKKNEIILPPIIHHKPYYSVSVSNTK